MSSLKYKTALLVDDNPIDNLINKRLLEFYGYAENIFVCHSGEEGLNIVHTLIKEEKPLPDVIFVDYRMPLMNGHQFIEKLEEITKRYPAKMEIYILSSSLDPSLQLLIKKLKQVKAFISKPLTINSFKAYSFE